MEFRLWATIVSIGSITAVLAALQVANEGHLALIWYLAGALGLTAADYWYTKAMLRVDALVRHRRPRKFALSVIVIFYGSLLFSFGCAAAAALARTATARLVCLLLIPVFLWSSAAALAVRDEFRS